MSDQLNEFDIEFRNQLAKNMIGYTADQILSLCDNQEQAESVANCIVEISKLFAELDYPQEFYMALRILSNGLDKMDDVHKKYSQFEEEIQ